MVKIAIFGDAYVARLQKYCRGDLGLPADVRFFGVGGMRADKVLHDERFKRAFDDMLVFCPDTVYINLGGNDIHTYSSPIEIMRHLQELFERLHGNGVTTIFYQEIGKRGAFRGTLSAQNFQQQRLAMNKKLRRKFKKHFVSLDKMLMFPDSFDSDLVHYNTNGMKIYAGAIRNILHS